MDEDVNSKDNGEAWRHDEGAIASKEEADPLPYTAVRCLREDTMRVAIKRGAVKRGDALATGLAPLRSVMS